MTLKYFGVWLPSLGNESGEAKNSDTISDIDSASFLFGHPV